MQQLEDMPGSSFIVIKITFVVRDVKNVEVSKSVPLKLDVLHTD